MGQGKEVQLHEHLPHPGSLRGGILEEVTPELSSVVGREVYPGKDKGAKCSSHRLKQGLFEQGPLSPSVSDSRSISLPLQGLCKLGSAGGTDYGLRQFAEGSTEKLAKQCRK